MSMNHRLLRIILSRVFFSRRRVCTRNTQGWVASESVTAGAAGHTRFV